MAPKEFVDAAVLLEVTGPFEQIQLELMRSEAPTPPLHFEEEEEEEVCEEDKDDITEEYNILEVVESEITANLEDVDEEELKTPLSAAQARLLKEMSSSLPILDGDSEKRMLKMWRSLKMWNADKETKEHELHDDSGMASEDDSETPTKSKNWKVRYSPYLTPRRELRIRAKEVMGLSGSVWQCERCDFWAYYKRDIRRHQSCAAHRAV